MAALLPHLLKAQITQHFHTLVPADSGKLRHLELRKWLAEAYLQIEWNIPLKKAPLPP